MKKNKKQNYTLTVYTIVMFLMAIGELFFNFNWTNSVVQVIFYVILYSLSALVCLGVSRCDKRIEYLIYVILLSTAIMGMNFWILISGIVVLFFSVRNVNGLSKIIITMSTILVIAVTMLFGMTNDHLVERKIIEDVISPNEKYVIQQEEVNANIGGTAIKVILHKEFIGIIDISYRVQLNDTKTEIIWIDNNTYTIDGVLMKVRF